MNIKKYACLIKVCFALLLLTSKSVAFIEEKNVIWIHAYDLEDLLAIQGLTNKISEEIENVEFFISTTTLSNTNYLEAYEFRNINPIKVIPRDNLETTAAYFQMLKPKILIVLQHEILPSALLIAHLMNIPAYLFNGSYSSQTERLLCTAPYLYITLFNSFDTIFTRSQKDAESFSDIGINMPKIICLRNLDAYNILARKNCYESWITKNKVNLSVKFHQNIMLAYITRKKEVDEYLELLKKLKKDIPDVKLIMIPRKFLTWKKKILNKINAYNFSCYVWNQSCQNISTSKNVFCFLGKTINEYDIILTNKSAKLFSLQAIAKLYLTNASKIGFNFQSYCEAAVWENPIISIAPRNRSLETALEQNFQISYTSNQEELYQKTKSLLTNDSTRNQIGKASLSALQGLSTIASSKVQVFLDDLKKIIHNKNQKAKCDKQTNNNMEK